MSISKNNLIKLATGLAKRIDLNGYHGNTAGHVGCALLSRGGKIYTGINVQTACGLGFCAEASAIAEMLKGGETEIDTIVAVTWHGKVIPPCGRCREFMYQVDTRNLSAKIMIDAKTLKTLADLLPYNWEVSKKSGAVT